MRIERRPDKCTAKLRRGEVKRVPQSAGLGLVGYYLACPACDRVQVLLATDVKIEETAVGHVPWLSIEPFRCTRCGALARVNRDELVVLEAARV
jgi:hypothetical protein